MVATLETRLYPERMNCDFLWKILNFCSGNTFVKKSILGACSLFLVLITIINKPLNREYIYTLFSHELKRIKRLEIFIYFSNYSVTKLLSFSKQYRKNGVKRNK